ncbi:hypothetical protein [Saccharomonospora xinjiangensis]|uniref:Uncharacterized protein n=1 Tax=Saccharomonospora xinjiangensis XJ-54 TaxID=882086 RepID=I0V4S5_9PSEU|nr:hypothetical protein [Saccharomonospora xinjiangensis]EID55128.1 hypothetical protein SacxiDRAFT_2915 [Saccharomonospora xinjiangensis XJ-54]
MTMHSLSELLDHRLPYDGPHGPDTVLEAARGLRELVRYLNNATGPGNGTQTLPNAPTVDWVLSNVATAVSGLDQLFQQLITALEHHADQASLYDDRRDRPGAHTARQAIANLVWCRATTDQLTREMQQAAALTSHLGHDLTD